MDRDGHGERSLLERRLEVADDGEVGFEVGQSPLALERLEEPHQVAGRRSELGRDDLDVVEPNDRIDVEIADIERFADDLAVDLAFGRDVDDGVAEDVGGARESSARGQPALLAVLGLDGVEWRQVLRPGLDPVLREAADALLDLAPAADPASAADGVDVDAEGSGRVQHGRPLGEPAAPARRGEDDERLGRRGHRAGFGLNAGVNGVSPRRATRRGGG